MNRLYKKHKLGTIILIWLCFIMVISALISSAVGFFLQDYYQKKQAFAMINDYIADCIESIDPDKDLNDYFDSWMDEVIDAEGNPRKDEFCDNDKLKRLCEYNERFFNEISIVDKAGIITHSSSQELIGLDIRETERMSPFACLLEGESKFSDDFTKSPYNDTVKEAYVGRAFRDKNGFVLFGLNEYNYNMNLQDQIEMATVDSRIGMTGYIINCDLDRKISFVTHTMKDVVGETFDEVSVLPQKEGKPKDTVCRLYGKECYVGAVKTSDYYVIGAYPLAEADQFRSQNNILFAALFIAVLVVFFLAFFVILKKIVIGRVEDTHTSLSRITDGDLEEKVTAGGSLELSELSQGINQTVDKLKGLIKAENERINAELQNAKYIQESAVPRKFPPFPDNDTFGLFAYMKAAKDVGGDFYDFFMTDENTLAIVMADVSEKGMPAALYMMRAKTLIKTYAEQGLSVEEVADQVNRKLCEDETAKMFVTAWIGFFHIPTGVLSYVHAGHTLPVLIGDEVSFVKQKINAVFGGFKKARYVRQEVRLSHGDSIFLYTDGVTEAHDHDGNMYGDKRLLELISKGVGAISDTDRNDFCRSGCMMVLDDLMDFVADADQYDDITMMWLKYS